MKHRSAPALLTALLVLSSCTLPRYTKSVAQLETQPLPNCEASLSSPVKILPAQPTTTGAPAHVHPSLWKQSTLTWEVDTRGGFPSTLRLAEMEKSVQAALDAWAAAGVFQFKRAEPGAKADISVGIYSPNGREFSRSGNRMAYAFYPWSPNRGKIFLDPEKRWTSAPFSLFAEALDDWLPHEIGHVLGLPHNHRFASVMNTVGPFMPPNPDDLQALRALYGLAAPVEDGFIPSSAPLPMIRSL